MLKANKRLIYAKLSMKQIKFVQEGTSIVLVKRNVSKALVQADITFGILITPKKLQCSITLL